MTVNLVAYRKLEDSEKQENFILAADSFCEGAELLLGEIELGSSTQIDNNRLVAYTRRWLMRCKREADRRKLSFLEFLKLWETIELVLAETFFDGQVKENAFNTGLGAVYHDIGGSYLKLVACRFSCSLEKIDQRNREKRARIEDLRIQLQLKADITSFENKAALDLFINELSAITAICDEVKALEKASRILVRGGRH